MRVLQITPRSPWPPVDGGRVAMLAITRGLMAAGCDVDLVSLNPRRRPVDEAEARAALMPARAMLVDHDTDALPSALLAAVTRRVSLPIARFASGTLERVVIEWLRRTNVDVVHLESVFLSWLIPAIRRHSHAAVVLRAQNIEYPILQQSASAEGDARKRLLLRGVASMLARSEVAAWNACDAFVAISRDDAERARALGCHVPLFVLPTGVDVSERTADSHSPVAWFLGSLDYRPNQQAALWIAQEIAPRVAALDSGVTIEIGGSHPPAALREELARHGVTLHADVADAAAFASSRGVAMTPVFSGGGMRIKILEAMARGKPVVATSIAASGMEVRNGEHLLIANDADSFAAAVVAVTRDAALRDRLVTNAGHLIETKYDNAVLGASLAQFYRRLVTGSRSSPRTARA